MSVIFRTTCWDITQRSWFKGNKGFYEKKILFSCKYVESKEVRKRQDLWIPAVRYQLIFISFPLLCLLPIMPLGLIWRPDIKDKDVANVDWHPSIVFT